MIFKKKKEIELLQKLEKNIINPVNVIQGYSSLLKNNKDLSKDVLDKINKIDSSSSRILNTIQSLLMLYEFDSKKTKINLEAIKLLSLSYSVLEKYIRIANVKKIKFDFEGQNTNTILSNKKILNHAISVICEEIFLILEKGNIEALIKKEGSDLLLIFNVYFGNISKVNLSDTPGYELAESLIYKTKGKVSFYKKDNLQRVTFRFGIIE